MVIVLKETSMPSVAPMLAINKSNSFTKITTITIANNIADAFRTGASILSAKPGAFFFISIPIVNGTAITAIKDLKTSNAGGSTLPISFPKYPNEKLMIKGIVKIVIKLFIAVKEIESGKSPLAIKEQLYWNWFRQDRQLTSLIQWR